MKNKFAWIGRKLPLILSMMLFLGGRLSAQTDIAISATVPTGSKCLQVGTNEAEFSLTISNKGQSSIIANSIIVNQNAGIEIISASYGGNNLVVSGKQIALETPVPAGGAIVVKYLKRAGCAVIPDATSDFFVSIKDAIVLNFTDGAGSKLVKSYTTSTYPVEFPGFQFQTPASPGNSIIVEMNKSFNSAIPVMNARGAGSAKDMLFSVTLGDAQAIAITGLTVTGGKATVALPYSVSGNIITAKLSASILATIDADGLFSSDEILTFTPTYDVTKYVDKVKADYSLDFEAQGTTCRRFTNATGIMYYSQEFPRPRITITEQNVSYGNWCGKKFSAKYIVTNTSNVNNSYYANNVTISPYLRNCTITKLSIGGVSLVNDGKGNYAVPTGIDFDRNGTASDFAPGHSVTVDFEVLPTDMQNSTFNTIEAQFNVYYVKINNEFGSVYNRNNVSATAQLFTVTGPADLDGGQSGSYSLNYSLNYYNANPVDDIIPVPSLVAISAGKEINQAPVQRNGRLKSDVTGYGDATMNIVFEEGKIIFKSDKPMRGIDIKLDTLQCKNLVWGKPTDLSKISSYVTKETDQLWIEWETAPFNSTVTESIIALNYTGKLPDTMTFRLNYAYYVNQNMKAVVDTIVVVFDVPDTTATIDTTETTIAEALLLQQVTVRPVPAVSDIQVNASFCISNLFIQDALGRIVNEMSGVDADELSVDISSLPQGMYFLHVLGSNGEIAHTSFNKE